MLFIAAVIIVLTGLVHSWAGERMLIGPMLAAEHTLGSPLRSGFMRRLVRTAWHVTTATWFGLAAALAFLGTEPLSTAGRQAVLAIAATFLIMGLASLAMSRGRHPAWAAFLVTAALCLAAAQTNA